MKTDTTSHLRDHFNQELCSGIQTQIGKIKKIKDIYIYIYIYICKYIHTYVRMCIDSVIICFTKKLGL